MTDTIRLCKDCNTPIKLATGRRRDKQFCNEKCKNHYHNKIAYEEEQEVKRINIILKKNRTILKKMSLRKDHEEIQRERLLKEGFDFNYHTHYKFTFHKNYQYTFCYDYGYRVNNDKYEGEIYKVVKAFEEKEKR
jgi:hypothetical protein